MMNFLQITIPLPVADNEGAPFPKFYVDWFNSRLRSIAGGYQLYPMVEGAWEEADGKIYNEPVSVYVSVIGADRLSELRSFLDEVCERFHQEAIFLGIAKVQMILIKPS